MNVAKILTAGTMALALAACTTPTSTNQNNNQNNTQTEVSKSISGKLTARSGAVNPKAILVTVEGDTQVDASLAFMNIAGTDADKYPGAKVVSVAADGTFKVDMKLGTKALTYGALMVWDDRNNDGKYSTSEVSYTAQVGTQAMAQFALTKTTFKEWVNGATEAEVKASYDFAFNEVKQSINFFTENAPNNAKVILRTGEGTTDAAVAGGLLTAPVTYAALDNGGYTAEVKLDQKPIKSVMVGMFIDGNSNGVFDDGETEAMVKDTTDQTTVAVRLSATEPDALKVYTDAQGTTAALALSYTFVFPK